MIATLRGTVVEKAAARVVIEAGGVGYEVTVCPSALLRLPPEGAEGFLHIAESVPMYGGGVTLYGFLSKEDKELFLCFKELPNTGAKKALELLEKASRSLVDFRRGIVGGDHHLLKEVFGFTKKTADRLITGLAEKLDGVPSHGTIRTKGGRGPAEPPGISKALDALGSLGYKPLECRSALDSVQRELGGRKARVEELVRKALRYL